MYVEPLFSYNVYMILSDTDKEIQMSDTFVWAMGKEERFEVWLEVDKRVRWTLVDGFTGRLIWSGANEPDEQEVEELVNDFLMSDES